MEFTTHLELQSQTTRLLEALSLRTYQAWTGLSPSTACHSRQLCPTSSLWYGLSRLQFRRL